MKFSYQWLQSFFKKKLPSPQKLADLLTEHSFEAEAGKKIGSDQVLEVELLPNRVPDAASHWGLAREIAALLDYPLSLTGQPKLKEQGQIKDALVVEVKDQGLCPRYLSRLITGVKVKPSPQWLKQRLLVCGLKPINNIVDIANYVMLETGQPLHAFDYDKLAGLAPKKIIVRRAQKEERITTLDQKEYQLNPQILVIADRQKPICLAGIKGGQAPEIDQGTKQVVLEAAHFSPLIVRQASRQLRLQTDASWRFEHGLSDQLPPKAIDLAAYLIEKIAQGQVIKGRLDISAGKPRPKIIGLRPEQVNQLLGLSLGQKQISQLLRRLGFGLVKKGRLLQVRVPSERLDIRIEEDLIEEIGRLYGYEKIPSQLPSGLLVPPERNESLFYQNQLREIMVQAGFDEAYNYSFVSKEQLSWTGLPLESVIEMANPISQEQKYLRPNLVLNLLKNIKQNQKYFNQVRLFEIGRVFQASGRKTVEKEKLALGLASLGGNKEGESSEAVFYQLKGVAEAILNKLAISDQWYDQAVDSLEILGLCHPLRQAEIRVGQELLGWLGQVKPEVSERIGLKGQVALLEISFDQLVRLAQEERIYQPPSKYPAITRDLAILVEPQNKVAEVLNLIHAAGGPLIKDIDLFDIYQGERIPQGRKSLAFHLIYQSDQRTLTDEEVNKIEEKIIQALTEKGWEVRKMD